MNSFVDAVPAFPYFSSEARSVLGIPDSMEVHLAVTELATALLEVARSSGRPAREQRVESLRVASGAVLFGWPLPLAERECPRRLNSDHPCRLNIDQGWKAAA